MNQYINAVKKGQSVAVDIDGVTTSLTVENVQQLLDWSISRLPVKDRTVLKEKFVAEKQFLFEASPDWVEKFEEAGYVVSRINKLAYSVSLPDKPKLTAENMQLVDSFCAAMDLVVISELSENVTEEIDLHGQHFKLSFPVAVAIRRNQERKTKTTETTETAE